jgi:hypothetical protein
MPAGTVPKADSRSVAQMSQLKAEADIHAQGLLGYSSDQNETSKEVSSTLTKFRQDRRSRTLR